MLLLAWVVVVSLSWVEFPDSHQVMGGPSADLQQATETDLDEIRSDVTTIRTVGAQPLETLAVHPSLITTLPLALSCHSLPRERLLSKLSVYRI